MWYNAVINVRNNTNRRERYMDEKVETIIQDHLKNMEGKIDTLRALRASFDEPINELLALSRALRIHLTDSRSTVPEGTAKEYNYLLEDGLLHPTMLDLLLETPKLLKKIDFTRRPGCWIWTGMITQGYCTIDVTKNDDPENVGRKGVRRLLVDYFFSKELLGSERIPKIPVCGHELCVSPFHSMPMARFLQLLKTNDANCEFGINKRTEYVKGQPFKRYNDDEGIEKEPVSENFLMDVLNKLESKPEQTPEPSLEPDEEDDLITDPYAGWKKPH